MNVLWAGKKMKNIDLMIFDFDGTLVNSGGDIASAVNYTLKYFNIPTMENSQIILYIGDGVQKLIEKSIGAHRQHLFGDALKIFSEYYAEHMLDTTALCDSVIEVLELYKNKKKIIITNKRKHYTVAMADGLGISKYFDEIIGADSTPYKKPNPLLLTPILAKFNIRYGNTVVIGDGINDIMLAINTGVLSCALLNGLTQRQELLALHPDFACEGLSELINIFI